LAGTQGKIKNAGATITTLLSLFTQWTAAGKLSRQEKIFSSAAITQPATFISKRH
jgi:hypothetical protein